MDTAADLATQAHAHRERASALQHAGDSEGARSAEVAAEICEKTLTFMGRHPRLQGVGGSTGMERAAGAASFSPSTENEKPAMTEPALLGSLPDCVSPAEQAIVTAIRARTRHNPISAHELGALIQRPERIARSVVAHLCCAHELPLCSTPGHSQDERGGYFWPLRSEDTVDTLAQLGSRRRELEERIKGIRAGAEREFKTGLLFGD